LFSRLCHHRTFERKRTGPLAGEPGVREIPWRARTDDVHRLQDHKQALVALVPEDCLTLNARRLRGEIDAHHGNRVERLLSNDAFQVYTIKMPLEQTKEQLLTFP
jgi:hypothetical protein